MSGKISKPRQRRSAETYERILRTAATLLEEVGLDKLNTNLICEHAGLTPPALYRYFPNKYAIMAELGQRLMRVQNEAVYRWLDQDDVNPTDPDTILMVLRGQYDISCAQDGGKWIMRSLHASPKLAAIRLQSHDNMVEQMTAAQRRLTPSADPVTIERKMRIMTETGYAIVEMLLDRPELNVDAILRETSHMLAKLN